MKSRLNPKYSAVVLFILLILFLVAGCKPKQIISEKVVTKVDSTAIANLQKELTKKDSITELLIAQLERSSEEISRLMSETSSHTIIYDTAAQVIPETGKYPILQEIITNTKSQLDKTIQEMEMLRKEYTREVNNLETEKSNLNLTIEALKEENSELKKKIVPATGFNFKLFFWGMIAGSAISLLIVFRDKLKKIFPFLPCVL